MHYLFVVLITFHSIFVFFLGSELINKAKNGTIPQQVADIFKKIGSQRKFCFDKDMFFNNWKWPWLYDWRKTDNDRYYVIDSHSRNDHGMCSPAGKAVVLRLNSFCPPQNQARGENPTKSWRTHPNAKRLKPERTSKDPCENHPEPHKNHQDLPANPLGDERTDSNPGILHNSHATWKVPLQNHV